MQDPENRVGAIPGSGSMKMSHPGMNMDANTIPLQPRADAAAAADVMVDLGWVAPPVALADLNDPLGGNGGQFCYIYV